MEDCITKPCSGLRRMMLIINPVSGRKTALRHLTDIIRIFTEKDFAVTVFPTGKCGDASEFARLYGNDFDIVVCIGGDGTLNETIKGLVIGNSHTPLGYIPAGSTNDFAACHKLSSDVLTAAANIANGNPKYIDIGRFGQNYFTCISAFGIFSWLSYTTSQNIKNILGHSAYIIDAVKDLPKIKAQHLKFNASEHFSEGDYIFGAVCNTTSVAGTFTLPEDIVNTGDGCFEVLLVHEPRTLKDFQNILTGIFTHDYSSPFLDFFQTDKLSIEASADIDWSLDGERSAGCDFIEVINLKKRLTLIC